MLKTTHEKTGKLIKPGDEVTDFRGDKWTFCGASRAREIGRSGKVTAKREDGWSQEFYDGVFSLIVEEA
jgi:hypothetical protein